MKLMAMLPALIWGIIILAVVSIFFGGTFWVWSNRRKLDPTSTENLAYQAASDITNKIAIAAGGDDYEGATLGTRIMDWQEAHIYNPVTLEVNIPVIGPAFNFARHLGEKARAAVVDGKENVSNNAQPAELGVDPLVQTGDPYDNPAPIQVFGA